MSEEDQLYGVVLNCADMIPIPVITNNPTNNTLVFNNALETTLGIASVGSDTLQFNSPALSNKVCR